MAADDFVPSRNPLAVYRDLANEEGGLLLHLESGQYHGVNATGFAIWELIDGTRTITEISGALSDTAASEDLIAEVRRFVEDLRQRDLLEP